MSDEAQGALVKVDILTFGDKPLRMMVDEVGMSWWLAKDVCDALGTDCSNLTKLLGEDERRTCTVQYTDQVRRVTFVNEPGVYTLAFPGRKPQAQAFRRWLAHEVLPSIRKTGRYLLPGQEMITRAEVEGLIKDALAAVRPGRLLDLPLDSDQSPTMLRFWDTLEQIPRETLDHSVHANELALNLPQFHRLVKEHGLQGFHPMRLKRLLRNHTAFLRQAKVNSVLWGKTAHCWMLHWPEVFDGIVEDETGAPETDGDGEE